MRERDRSRPSAHRRGYDSGWREIRARVLAAVPFCVECGDRACVVDHIRPLSNGGTHDVENLRSMCKRCHDRRTAKDQAFGKTAPWLRGSLQATRSGPR